MSSGPKGREGISLISVQIFPDGENVSKSPRPSFPPFAWQRALTSYSTVSNPGHPADPLGCERSLMWEHISWDKKCKDHPFVAAAPSDHSFSLTPSSGACCQSVSAELKSHPSSPLISSSKISPFSYLVPSLLHVYFQSQ